MPPGTQKVLGGSGQHMGVKIHNNRHRGERWRECAMCGFEYPESAMYIYKGRYYCYELDNDENRVRQADPMEFTRRERTGLDVEEKLE